MGYHRFFKERYAYDIDAKLNVRTYQTKYLDLPVKRYSFNSNIVYKRSHAKYLIPPYGFNLLNIIENYEDVKQEVITLFREYNLDTAFDKASQTIKIIQKKKTEKFS
jgi:hypothetical protein